VRIEEFSFRSGKRVVSSKPEVYASILAALVNAQEASARNPKISSLKHLRREFSDEGWNGSETVRDPFFFEKYRVSVHLCASAKSVLRTFSRLNSEQFDARVLVALSRTGLHRAKQLIARSPQARLIPIWLIWLK
jgi:hypothetical protein